MRQHSPYVPTDKHDLAAVQAAMAAGWPAIAPVVPDLLAWMQDPNWPLARTLAPLLASLGAPLAPAIRQILDGDDAIWKHNLIFRVVAPSPTLLQALAADLHRLATHPSASDRAEEVDIEARAALLLL
ncbi:DUF5071 domain-containing protein [Massilia sp. CCM 8695]|uniref:DUF5071 domain-containing protein n=1 Tax=Massilia frigida TaxID=2609281 RepID=A0ABX0NAB0_9BURK|nr:DUF5071 domain-containing protein [Massilia frigida]NHZ78695.1 DUF5071 domain-containing protein [Massilia frigida]